MARTAALVAASKKNGVEATDSDEATQPKTAASGGDGDDKMAQSGEAPEGDEQKEEDDDDSEPEYEIEAILDAKHGVFPDVRTPDRDVVCLSLNHPISYKG